MSIQQALFAQNQAPGEWQIVDFHRYSADGATFTLNNLQQNDLIFVHVGADTVIPGTVNDSNFTTRSQGGINSIGYMISSSVYSSASSTFSFTISGTQPDYGLAVAIRSPNRTGSYGNLAVRTYEYGYGTPTHANGSVFDVADSFQLLSAMVDDDDASPMGSPTGTTLIAEDVNASRGSIGLAYQIISTAGTYSWGSWTTTGSDSYLTAIRSIREV
tara:strand:- start:15822 stop:16469 length:648 start_codon:yes stop_codon:yes gene_type:complete